jgi:hypothetical protein
METVQIFEFVSCNFQVLEMYKARTKTTQVNAD